jgi:hypothetical protein
MYKLGKIYKAQYNMFSPMYVSIVVGQLYRVRELTTKYIRFETLQREPTTLFDLSSNEVVRLFNPLCPMASKHRNLPSWF